MLVNIDKNSSRLNELLKVHFNISKQVAYGKAVYVVGNISRLGMWSVDCSLRLSWNQGHEWSGSIQLHRKLYNTIQLKYVVADWEYPSNQRCEWEEGLRNRKLSLQTHRNSIVCNHKWAFDKITLFLTMTDHIQGNNQYYIIGNIPQLGSWKSNRKMSLVKSKNYSVQNLLQKKRSCEVRQETTYSYSFSVSRNLKNIRYYYIRKNISIVAERNPGRMLDLNNLKNKRHPDCQQIKYNTGDMQIFQICKFNQLNFSKITEQIYVGAYLRTEEDFEQLRKKNINTVFSIQSKEDFNSHSLSPDYLKTMCLQNGIKYNCYSIRDMNSEDFIQKCLGGFLMLRNLLIEGTNKVYVHCSAGIYRSPQLIVLYLVLNDGYGLDQAIQMVTEKHPFARPNYILLSQALGQISRQMPKLMIEV